MKKLWVWLHGTHENDGDTGTLGAAWRCGSPGQREDSVAVDENALLCRTQR